MESDVDWCEEERADPGTRCEAQRRLEAAVRALKAVLQELGELRAKGRKRAWSRHALGTPFR